MNHRGGVKSFYSRCQWPSFSVIVFVFWSGFGRCHSSHLVGAWNRLLGGGSPTPTSRCTSALVPNLQGKDERGRFRLRDSGIKNWNWFKKEVFNRSGVFSAHMQKGSTLQQNQELIISANSPVFICTCAAVTHEASSPRRRKPQHVFHGEVSPTHLGHLKVL